jgi:phosphoribosyl 1,2-cyclic phosphodiesterase
MLKLCVLGSGSKGNSIYLSDGESNLLIDAGLSAHQINLRLHQIGVPLSSIHAAIVSHEHTDHVAAIPILTKKYGIGCYANRLTAEEMLNGTPVPNLHIFTTGEAFSIGAFDIHPFTVPHDAVDPVGFDITHSERKLSITTDLGHATTLVRETLKGADYLVLEANHDEDMLMEDIRRPWALKQRIRSKIGHLSNNEAGRLLAEIAGEKLKKVLLAHISRDCNTTSMAENTVRHYLKESGMEHIDVVATHQHRIAELITLA